MQRARPCERADLLTNGSKNEAGTACVRALAQFAESTSRSVSLRARRSARARARVRARVCVRVCACACVLVRVRASSQRGRGRFAYSLSLSMTTWAVNESRPDVGSSQKRSAGSVSSSVAMQSRLRSPPETPRDSTALALPTTVLAQRLKPRIEMRSSTCEDTRDGRDRRANLRGDLGFVSQHEQKNEAGLRRRQVHEAKSGGAAGASVLSRREQSLHVRLAIKVLTAEARDGLVVTAPSCRRSSAPSCRRSSAPS
eukprot:3503464-Pleurochrysis_carterae.AAC.2